MNDEIHTLTVITMNPNDLIENPDKIIQLPSGPGTLHPIVYEKNFSFKFDENKPVDTAVNYNEKLNDLKEFSINYRNYFQFFKSILVYQNIHTKENDWMIITELNKKSLLVLSMCIKDKDYNSLYTFEAINPVNFNLKKPKDCMTYYFSHETKKNVYYVNFDAINFENFTLEECLEEAPISLTNVERLLELADNKEICEVFWQMVLRLKYAIKYPEVRDAIINQSTQ